MKEPSKDNMENPDMSKIENESNNLSMQGLGGAGSQATKSLGNFTNTATSGPNHRKTKPEETDEDIKPLDELKEMKAQRTTGSEAPSGSSPLSSDLTKDGITMIANDDPVSRYSHFADRLNKYIKTTQYLPEYNKIVREHNTEIRRVVAIIRKMNAINNASWSHYKMSGKLDSSTFYKKDNYKIFKKKNAPAPAADLVISLLIDNSGSMQGKKAKLAGKALIIFCEALNRLHIPFSVDAFTEANAAITISLKTFDESYDKQKTNMTLLTEQFDCRQLSTWCANIDEVNLQYVSQQLLNRKEKDKVLIVISDGATCGSWKDLKQTAENIEKRGVTILGIGIFDKNVEDIYSSHVVLREQKDLEMLGAFLNKYLIGKIFK
jgi:cobalamin biosynthesis protein CobT